MFIANNAIVTTGFTCKRSTCCHNWTRSEIVKGERPRPANACLRRWYSRSPGPSLGRNIISTVKATNECEVGSQSTTEQTQEARREWSFLGFSCFHKEFLSLLLLLLFACFLLLQSSASQSLSWRVHLVLLLAVWNLAPINAVPAKQLFIVVSHVKPSIGRATRKNAKDVCAS